MKFYGRKRELERLNSIWYLPRVKTVVMKGRRRVGKSQLVREYAKNYKLIEFVGTLSHSKSKNLKVLKKEEKIQIDNLCHQLSEQFFIKFQANNWAEFFWKLISLINKMKDERVVIFFDEVSWMGKFSSDFVGHLKNIIDQVHNKENVMLIFCGSISLWVEDSLIKSRAMTGRIDLTMTIEELTMEEANLFFPKNLSEKEKFKALMAIGAVPRYLESFDYSKTFEANLNELAFNKDGVFFQDFEAIFTDSLSMTSEKYLTIIELLSEGKKTFKEIEEHIAQVYQLKNKFTKLNEMLRELVISGFIAKDYWVSLTKTKKQSSYYRLKDNYLRFYLKVIKKYLPLIEQRKEVNMSEIMDNFSSIQGLQFENLVRNNFEFLIDKFKMTGVIGIGPYVQKSGLNQKGVQIDLMIVDKYYNVYAFEIKFQNDIGNKIIDEIKEKDLNLKRLKKFSVRNCLVYSGELPQVVVEDKYMLNAVVNFGEILKPAN